MDFLNLLSEILSQNRLIFVVNYLFVTQFFKMADEMEVMVNVQTPHSKRCCNPMQIQGHIGKDLRKISKNILCAYPTLHAQSKVCRGCRDIFNSSRTNLSSENNSADDSAEIDDTLEKSPSKKRRASREEELEELLNGLKEKFHNLPDNEPLRQSILTIAPDCWSIRKISEEFKCSYRMAKQSKNLKHTGGVLAIPPFKKGKNLDEKTVQKVIEFYENDTNGRIMPNKKDTVVVKIDDQKERKQKHLLLYDIKVLHSMFKKKYPEHPIGLSKFAELRPKWCVVAGASGTHSVCVCTTHQNVKLMIDSINVKHLTKDFEIKLDDYNDCIKIVLCKNPTSACYFLKCEKCPNMEKLSDIILQLLENNNIQQVIYSTWTSTDRCTLKQECLTSEDFIEELCQRLKVLITHNFISKEQSKFLCDKKENLRKDEVLLHCDFAENYAYVVQDAAQAFHYNNDQCSVFTVIFYYRSGNELKHHSIILLSDSTTHDATAVYLMQQNVIPEIKKRCPRARKIYYVSDGAKQHFKNRTNILHLMNHKADFDIEAEWHCYATAHGKSECDGLGACLKCEATRYSLQAEPKNAILDSTSLFTWAKKKFQNIQFFHYTKMDHEKLSKTLNKKFPQPRAVDKIQSNHAFIPTSGNKLIIKKYSSATECVIMQY